MDGDKPYVYVIEVFWDTKTPYGDKMGCWVARLQENHGWNAIGETVKIAVERLKTKNTNIGNNPRVVMASPNL